MYILAVYCVGIFNMCQGIYYTESNPRLSWNSMTLEKCREQGPQDVRVEMFKNPGKDIRWKCIDISAIKAPEDTR